MDFSYRGFSFAIRVSSASDGRIWLITIDGSQLGNRLEGVLAS